MKESHEHNSEDDIDQLKARIYEPLIKLVVSYFVVFTLSLMLNGYLFGKEGYPDSIFIGFIFVVT